MSRWTIAMILVWPVLRSLLGCGGDARRGRCRWEALPGLALLAIALLAAPAAQAQEPVDDLQLSAVLMYGPQCPPDAWVPVHVQLTNPSAKDIDGYISLPVNDPAAGASIRRRCLVPARSRLGLVIHAYFPPTQTSAGGGASLARVEWHSAAGARLAVTDLVGRLSSSAAASPVESVLVVRGAEAEGDAEEQGAVADVLESAIGSRLLMLTIDVERAPRQGVGYAACRLVLLQAVDPNELDIAQRRALLDHLLCGGTLLIAAPGGSAMPEGTWLQPYWPVQCVGSRQATAISGRFKDRGSLSLQLRKPSSTTEAIAGRGEVLLRDGDHVHVAQAQVGLGRVVFTSFPGSAVDPNDAGTLELWQRLFASGREARWEMTQLSAGRDGLLESMIGQPTASWSVAATIVAGYIALALVAHVLLRGVHRPTAFGVIAGVATIGAMALVMVPWLGRQEQELLGARLATMDLASGGGGLYQEELTWLGQDNEQLALEAVKGAALRPIAADAARPPVLEVDPFAAPTAGSRRASIDRVWRATSPVDTAMQVEARGVFGPDGLSLTIRNRLEQELDAPLLLWNATGRVLPLQAIAPQTDVRIQAAGANQRGDYSAAGMLASETSRLRERIIESVATPSLQSVQQATPQHRPLLLAWLDERSLPRVLSWSEQPRFRTQALLRAAVEIEPSDPGTVVRIDGSFVRVIPAPNTTTPFDVFRQTWNPTSVSGQWLVGFAAPPQIGRLRPMRATLRIWPQAPQHVVVIRAGQAANGSAPMNPAGRVLARWTNAVDRQEVSFEVRPEDADSEGHIWLVIGISGDAAAATAAQWAIHELALTIEAEVVDGAGSGADAGGAL